MRESTTYQWVIEQGELLQSRKMLLKQGRAKFGPPTPEQANKLKAIEDLERLERLAVRLLKVDSWDALLRGR